MQVQTVNGLELCLDPLAGQFAEGQVIDYRQAHGQQGFVIGPESGSAC
ncbi:MAG: hypothetical protein GWO11_08330 [Desulfuromonadales bacterium]|nr:hypothetical protein [Desulfuromonadales bacterium]NIR34310.1 hypothetical protein [Desulfuromonadales bacterium]NIS44285.1 hypothetical protein [Desulfuromonadales bacterium]